MSITTPMSCSISAIVVPYWSFTSRMKRHMSCFSYMFIPAIGSSRSSTSGSAGRARASSTRFCSPYGSRPTGVLRTCWISRKSITSSTLRRCSSSSRFAGPIQIACWRKLVRIFRLRPVMMLSRTVMPLNSAMFWKVRAMPIAAASWLFMSDRVSPLKVIRPCCGWYTPLITFSIELLPAPFGPMIARTSCSRTSNDTSCSAFPPPNESETPSTTRTGAPIFRWLCIGRRGERSGGPASRGSRERLRVDDLQRRGDRAGATVLELHLRLDVAVALAAVERVDRHLVPLGDEAPAHLPRPGDLAVVGVELLVQDEEAVDLRPGELGVGGEVGIHLLDAPADELVDRALRREVAVAGVCEVAPLGPVADRVEVDVDERAHHVALVPERDRLADVGKELELVLEVLRREQRAVLQLADVLRAVDDLQVAVRVQIPGVAGVEPAVVRLHLGSRFGVLVVRLEEPRRADQDLAGVGHLDLDALHRRADGVDLHLAIRLHAHEHRGLGGPVELLQVDPDRAVEHEEIGSDRLAGGVGELHPAHAEDVAQRPVHEQVAEPVEAAVDDPDRLLRVQDPGADAAREAHEVVVHAALQPPRVLHADCDLGEQPLQHRRRREVVGRADLAHVGHHRRGRLGDRKST